MLLVLGTHNQKKGVELRQLLEPFGFELKTLADFSNAIEVVEDGDSFQANARLKAEQQAVNERWQNALKESQERKSITLRLQMRDIKRLKGIARRRGIPYQTLVSSVLHQFANGDIVERV